MLFNFAILLYDFHQSVPGVAGWFLAATTADRVYTEGDLQGPCHCWPGHHLAVQTLQQAPQGVCLHCVVSLIPQNLLLGNPVEPLNVGDDDGDNEVDPGEELRLYLAVVLTPNCLT